MGVEHVNSRGEEKLEEEFKNGEDFTLTPGSSSRNGTINSISSFT
jgi:hypothetical protein